MPHPGETVTVVQPEARLVDPLLLTDNRNHRNILLAVFDTLVERTASGRFGPALAERWSVSDNAREWTFRIRDGVQFHDGSTLRATDVVSFLQRARDVSIDYFGTLGVLRTYFDGALIDGLGRDRVRVVLREPMADLLDLLSEIPIPAATSQEVGSGPMRLEDADDEHVRVSAHRGHWRGGTTVAEVIWRRQPDPNLRAEAILAGRAGIATDIPAILARSLPASPARVHAQRSSLCVVLMINLARDTLHDRRVRAALNVALDRKRIATALFAGQAAALDGPVTAQHFGYAKPQDPFAFSPNRARELLRSAGFRDGLPLTIDIPTTMPDEASALLELIALDYRLSGIEVRIKRHENRAAYADLVRAKAIADACLFDSSPLSTYRVLREKLSSEHKGPWWQGYHNPAFEALLRLAEATPSPSARRRAYASAINIVRDDAPWVFLYSPRRLWATAPGAPFDPRVDGTLKWTT